jgi:hypothetical protein
MFVYVHEFHVSMPKNFSCGKFVWISGHRIILLEWHQGMEILIWIFHGKMWQKITPCMFADDYLNNILCLFASMNSLHVCWWLLKQHLVPVCFYDFFLHAIFLNSNLQFTSIKNSGNGSLVSHQTDSMHPGQKQHHWIFWCVPNLRLILKKLGPVLNK